MNSLPSVLQHSLQQIVRGLTPLSCCIAGASVNDGPHAGQPQSARLSQPRFLEYLQARDRSQPSAYYPRYQFHANGRPRPLSYCIQCFETPRALALGAIFAFASTSVLLARATLCQTPAITTPLTQRLIHVQNTGHVLMYGRKNPHTQTGERQSLLA